jgi:hypothetical protein
MAADMLMMSVKFRGQNTTATAKEQQTLLFFRTHMLPHQLM